MARYRVAFIGCGSRGKAHAAAYVHIPEGELVACCAPGAKNREEMAHKYGTKAYADPAEMLRTEKPDIVHISTPPWTRVELLTTVSDAGVPMCTTEKPIATGVKDWRALCALEQTSNTKFTVCHQFRWQPHLMKCQEALRSGSLGNVRFLDISAGMNIAGQGTHTLNYGMSLVGDSPVVRVFGNASGWSNSDPMHPGADRTEAYLTFANGVRGMWTSGPISPVCGDPGTTWQHVRVAAYADRGRVLYEEFGNWEIAGEKGTQSGTWGGWDIYGPNNTLAQANFHKAMIRWYEEGDVPGTNLKQSLHEWAVVLALYQSTLERRPIEMATFDPADDLVDRLIAELSRQQ